MNVKTIRDEAIKARAKAERAKEQAEETKKQAEETKEQVEWEAYEMGVAETETNLKTQVPRVCRLYCSQVWAEALNQARVEASSELQRVENVYYTPPAIRESAPTSSEANVAPKAAEAGQDSATNAFTPLDKPAKETEHPGVLKKEKTINQETPQDVMKPPTNPQAPTIENEAPKKIELVLASLAMPTKAVPPPSQGSEASDTASQQPLKDKLTIKLKKQVVSVYLYYCCCCFFFFFWLYLKFFFLVMKLPFL